MSMRSISLIPCIFSLCSRTYRFLHGSFCKKKVNPGIVKVPVNLGDGYPEAMLANSITLTPGTITLDITEEEGQDYFYIHWIDVSETDRDKAGDMIKGTLEKWIRRIWK